MSPLPLRSPGLRPWMHRIVGVFAVISLLVACGGEDDPAAELTAEPVASPDTATTASPSPDATTPQPTTEASPTPAETTAPTATDEGDTALPGEPFGMARADTDYAVVGVAHDDVLNVRSGPGVDAGIVAELPPDGSATATGRDRLLESSGAWFELDVDGTTGWANARYLAVAGQTADITSEIVDASGGDLIEAETMLALGEAVAATRASEEPPSDIVVSVAPSVGDLGEITVDVIGLGDDAVRGERLKVFGTPSEGAEGFVLKSVEMTLLCGRGESDGLCV